MKHRDLAIDPYVNDVGHLGVSLANLAEILLPVLDAAGARSVVEVGAYAGDLTGLLSEWAQGAGARVVAVDPSPQPALVELAEGSPCLELVRETSLEALAHIDMPDVVIVDGDHNYWTVSEELRAIGDRAGGSLPLLLFHDITWPHGRRDDYYRPALVPDEHRQPTVEWGAIHPDEPGLHPEGMFYRWPASREGGPRNGVLTAVEDFVAAREGLRLAVVPAFFGFGAVWPTSAPWAGAVAEILDPWDRNPLLERLEDNRVRHLALSRHRAVSMEFQEEREKLLDTMLGMLLDSRAFGLAQRISGLRRGEPAFTRDEVRRALDETH